MRHDAGPGADGSLSVTLLHHGQMLLFYEPSVVEEKRICAVEGIGGAVDVVEDVDGFLGDVVNRSAVGEDGFEETETVPVCIDELLAGGLCCGEIVLVEENGHTREVAGVEYVHVWFGVAKFVLLFNLVDGRIHGGSEAGGCVRPRRANGPSHLALDLFGSH